MENVIECIHTVHCTIYVVIINKNRIDTNEKKKEKGRCLNFIRYVTISRTYVDRTRMCVNRNSAICVVIIENTTGRCQLRAVL